MTFKLTYMNTSLIKLEHMDMIKMIKWIDGLKTSGLCVKKYLLYQ